MLTLGLTLPGVVIGLATDRDKPIEIVADYAEIDDIQGVATYTGKVVVTQGSIRLTGDLMTVRYAKNNEVTEITLDGKPARFQQRLDNSEEYMKGEGKKIEYYARNNLMVLIDKAKVTQRGQIYTGYRMEYDTKSGLFKIKGGGPGTGQQVRPTMVLPPQNSASGQDQKVPEKKE